MCRHIRVRSRAELMRETLREALDSRLGCVIGGVSTVQGESFHIGRGRKGRGENLRGVRDALFGPGVNDETLVFLVYH